MLRVTLRESGSQVPVKVVGGVPRRSAAIVPIKHPIVGQTTYGTVQVWNFCVELIQYDVCVLHFVPLSSAFCDKSV